MTKSTITRERLEALANAEYCKSNPGAWLLRLKEVNELARMALAAMDSEPVFTLEVSQADYKGQKLGNHFGFITLDAARNLKEGNYQLYRHAQAAPVVPDEKDKTVDADDHPLLWSFNEGWNACPSAMLAASTQSPGSEPATVPGKWIPVSERMPERGDYLVTDGCDFDVQLFNGEQFIPGFVWEDKITHWMPLPAAPQEVKGE
ncbi:DUF551 domain-containing protein [Klebsiella pneumoniae]|uniref:DUF551 domain-containing protein n=1 Tax=Klebsiella pneumoniae TaxID=573 RepID=UPI00188982B3|nr:DUF551 domain-containing protein [Klebsiella pneumoniae]